MMTNDLIESWGTYKIADRLIIEANWKAGKLHGRLHAKFPLIKAEVEQFYNEGKVDGKERVIIGEVTPQMIHFVKNLDL